MTIEFHLPDDVQVPEEIREIASSFPSITITACWRDGCDDRTHLHIPDPRLGYLEALEVQRLDDIEALIDMARQGGRPAFNDLALALGIERAKLDEVWAGVQKRIKK